MPISIALSKFLSCNDIILLVMWAVMGENIVAFSSFAQKCRLNDHVYTYLALTTPPARSMPVPHIISLDEHVTIRSRTTWIMEHCVFTLHVPFQDI